MNDDSKSSHSTFPDALITKETPKTIVYNMNPKDSMARCTMIGNSKHHPLLASPVRFRMVPYEQGMKTN